MPKACRLCMGAIYNTLRGKIGFGNKIDHSVAFVPSTLVFHTDSESVIITECSILLWPQELNEK